MLWGREHRIKPGRQVFLLLDSQSLALAQTGGTNEVRCAWERPETGRLLLLLS